MPLAWCPFPRLNASLLSCGSDKRRSRRQAQVAVLFVRCYGFLVVYQQASTNGGSAETKHVSFSSVPSYCDGLVHSTCSQQSDYYINSYLAVRKDSVLYVTSNYLKSP